MSSEFDILLKSKTAEGIDCQTCPAAPQDSCIPDTCNCAPESFPEDLRVVAGARKNVYHANNILAQDHVGCVRDWGLTAPVCTPVCAIVTSIGSDRNGRLPSTHTTGRLLYTTFRHPTQARKMLLCRSGTTCCLMSQYNYTGPRHVPLGFTYLANSWRRTVCLLCEGGGFNLAAIPPN